VALVSRTLNSAGFASNGQSTRAAAMSFSEVANDVMDIVRVPMWTNNYGWILRDRETGTVAAVDPAEPTAIQSALEDRYLSGLSFMGVI
jgi:hypothetical protein